MSEETIALTIHIPRQAYDLLNAMAPDEGATGAADCLRELAISAVAGWCGKFSDRDEAVDLFTVPQKEQA